MVWVIGLLSAPQGGSVSNPATPLLFSQRATFLPCMLIQEGWNLPHPLLEETNGIPPSIAGHGIVGGTWLNQGPSVLQRSMVLLHGTDSHQA